MKTQTTALACLPADPQATDADTVKRLHSIAAIKNLRLSGDNAKIRAKIIGLCLDQIHRNWGTEAGA